MNPYNKDAFCTKCGGMEITSVYHQDSTGCSVVQGVCYWVKPEHMLRHCKNCHWEWLEKPLNIKEAK